MRSFAGIVHTDGSPPDARLLHALGELLRLPSSSAPAVQVDDRCGLVSVAHRAGTPAPSWFGGSEHAMRAWSRWGADCVEHLFNDFSFAVWDPATRELFCARDRFGVRPFFYAHTDRGIVFSDLLDAVIAHPAVRVEDLDAGAVSDYLTGGVSDEDEATIFAQVRRLPPAHTLTVRCGAIALRRYWTLPESEPRKDAPERFLAALREAVADGVTSDSAVVFMSGGLDSTSLAVLAREQKPHTRLTAFTSVYRTRIADVEEPYAVEAARSIGIPIRLCPLDGYPTLDVLEKKLWTADPGSLITASMTRDIYAAAAEVAPIALHGHPADALLWSDPPAVVRKLRRDGRFLSVAAALVRYTMARRRPPWFFLRDLVGRPRRRRGASAPPEWLRSPLPERAPAAHPLSSPSWSNYFEWAHPRQTGAAIELVYPWCDVRVVESALSLPPIPWLVDKHVVRTLLRNRVSETIRRRRKTFLNGDPWTAALPAPADLDIDVAAQYIDPARFRQACAAANGFADATLRGLVFAYWLRELPAAVRRLRSILNFPP